MKASDLEFYCITDQNSSRGRDDGEIALSLVQGGASALQYRSKKVEASLQWATALKLRRITRRAGVPLIINDRVDLALACGADGVHIGQDDIPPAVVRRMAGRKLWLGISTHSLAQALKAQAQGADYIGFGPVFATQTKEHNVSPVGLGRLTEILGKIKVPVVAIGGIKAGHLPALAQAGAKNIAVVTALTSAGNVRAATAIFKKSWQKEKSAH